MLAETIAASSTRQIDQQTSYKWQGCVLGWGMVVGTVLLCVIAGSGDRLERLDLPSDSQDKTCSLDYAHSHPLLYVDLQSPTPIYRCVARCPDETTDNEAVDSSGNTVLSPYSEHPDFTMGGICMSSAKRTALASRGLLEEILFKEAVLGKMGSLVLVMGMAGAMAGGLAILFYCLPVGVSFTLVGAWEVVVLGGFMWKAVKMDHNWQLYMGIAVCLLAMVAVGWVQGWQRLKKASTHAQALLLSWQSSPSRISPRLLLTLLLSSALTALTLLLILWQYLSLVSSDPLTKPPSRIFFSADKHLWKYLLLGVQWMFLSQFVAACNCYAVTSLARQIVSGQEGMNFTLGGLMKIGQAAMMQTILWIPIKITLFFKPQGALLHEKDQQSGCCLAITRCSHYLCGAGINYLHAYTFNPFLVDSSDLWGSLRAVQLAYHRVDPAYDCSSLWLYRFSSCLCVGVGCLLLGDGQLGSSCLFDLFALLFGLQIAYPWLSSWSLLMEAQQFKDILSQ